MNTETIDLRPRITVVGVGGAGGNAVCNMIRAKLEGVQFIVANTDAQALNESLVDSANKIQLGLHVTQGLGAGSKPDVGRASAEESHEDILRHLRGSNMVFITAGMGGGTGTGAAPVIARAAREEGILTVGVVTKPFHFEGAHRSRTAERGIEELQQYVDTLIVIPNQNLFRIANERTTFADAFKMADDVLYSGVRGVTDLMMMPGLINLDFADIRAVMGEMGKAMMGTGEAAGERRALDAAEAAISNPLLDEVSMKGARGVLINITGGYDMTLYEVDEAANRIRDEVDPEANIIFGSTFDEKLNGTIRVSVVATGIGEIQQQPQSSLNVHSSFGSRSIQMAAAAKDVPASENTDFSFQTEELQEQKDIVENVEGVSVEHDSQNFEQGELFPFAPQAPKPFFASDMVSSDESGIVPENAFLSTPLTPESSAQEPESEPTPERRRPASLFERFTGVSRTKSQQTEPELKNIPEKEEVEDLDMLEIPAFLRRGN